MTCRAQDRRQSRRRAGVQEHGIVAVRIRPGYEALMVDASANGVLIETAHRLMPGRAVELLMETSASTEVVRGRVLRSAVSTVRPSSISYRAAIGFDRALAWYANDASGSRAPIGASRPGTDFRADATPQVI
jgi:PilZ domain-containing protein